METEVALLLFYIDRYVVRKEPYELYGIQTVRIETITDSKSASPVPIMKTEPILGILHSFEGI